MAKKYKFKLEALLKIRKIREDQCKTEIGRVQIEISKVKADIAEQSRGIAEAYDLQEQSLQGGATGLETRFHPYFVEGKRSHIDSLEKNLKELEDRVTRLYQILSQFRADVKVIDEMKTKDQKAYKKATDKKMHQEIEEQVQNWKQVTK
jgi:flagellar export protein FliJ